MLPALNSIKRVQHDLRSHLEELATQLVQTRQILLHEMMDAFDVVESAEMGCQFQIASLPVPPLSRLQGKHQHQQLAVMGGSTMLKNSRRSAETAT